QAYIADIEARETPGTPAILQTMRAALAMELKEKLGVDRIERREEELAARAYERLSAHPGIALMGDVGPEHRLPIFSFNIRIGSSWLHPRFVTTLLNDLFGIQSRAGCSCAAPYGHRILHIDRQRSSELRKSIMDGNIGLKPGWTRVNFHFLHTDDEVDFLCDAILFVADNGTKFLPLYEFDIRTGAWRCRGFEENVERCDLDTETRPAASATLPAGAALFRAYLEEALRRAGELGERFSPSELKHTEENLIPFLYVQEAQHGVHQ
ncbi:MAG TPA: aminotransferase class V-fold PLP-dependent enzyme, partial [Spirochaetia bacterium]